MEEVRKAGGRTFSSTPRNFGADGEAWPRTVFTHLKSPREALLPLCPLRAKGADGATIWVGVGAIHAHPTMCGSRCGRRTRRSVFGCRKTVGGGARRSQARGRSLPALHSHGDRERASKEPRANDHGACSARALFPARAAFAIRHREERSDVAIREPWGARRSPGLLPPGLVPGVARNDELVRGPARHDLRQRHRRNAWGGRPHPAQPAAGAERAVEPADRGPQRGAASLRDRPRHRRDRADRIGEGVRRRRRHQGDAGQDVRRGIPRRLHLPLGERDQAPASRSSRRSRDLRSAGDASSR